MRRRRLPRTGETDRTLAVMIWTAPSEKDSATANPPFVNAMDTAMRVSARPHPGCTLQDLPERQVHERLKDITALRSRERERVAAGRLRAVEKNDKLWPGRCFPFGVSRTDWLRR